MTATDGTNPYAPPKARVADPELTTHGLKRRSVLMMILFVVLSLGIYYVIWWFRRRPGLNRLNSPRKLPVWPLALLVFLWVLNLAGGVMDGLEPGRPVQGQPLLSLFQIAVGISMIVYCFWAKEIIEDHARPEPGSGPAFGTDVRLSGIMTFFFSIFYLQWAINKYVIDGQR